MPTAIWSSRRSWRPSHRDVLAGKARDRRDGGADGLASYGDISVAELVRDHSGGKGFDAVLDTVGGRHLQNCFDALRDHGQVVSLARSEADFSQATYRSLSHHGVFMLLLLLTGQNRTAHGRILREIAKLVDRGAIVPLVDAVPFSLWDAGAGHRRLKPAMLSARSF